MTNVQIRDVPEDVLADLKSVAASRGQSLQGYYVTCLSRTRP